jgi:hypothetical protein
VRRVQRQLQKTGKVVCLSREPLWWLGEKGVIGLGEGKKAEKRNTVQVLLSVDASGKLDRGFSPLHYNSSASALHP